MEDWKKKSNEIADWARSEIKGASKRRKKKVKKRARKIADEARRTVFKAGKTKGY